MKGRDMAKAIRTAHQQKKVPRMKEYPYRLNDDGKLVKMVDGKEVVVPSSDDDSQEDNDANDKDKKIDYDKN